MLRSAATPLLSYILLAEMRFSKPIPPLERVCPKKTEKSPQIPPKESANTPAVPATQVAAGEKDPNPAAVNPRTSFKTAEEQKHQVQAVTRRDEVIPPYGGSPEKECPPRERPGEGTRPYGYIPESAINNPSLNVTVKPRIECAAERPPRISRVPEGQRPSRRRRRQKGPALRGRISPPLG